MKERVLNIFPSGFIGSWPSDSGSSAQGFFTVFLNVLFIAFFILILSACGPTIERSINFDPSEPLRVAVMPVRHEGASLEFAPPTDNLLIDQVGIVSSEQADSK